MMVMRLIDYNRFVIAFCVVLPSRLWEAGTVSKLDAAELVLRLRVRPLKIIICNGVISIVFFSSLAEA
jgi:hypothetical protein